MALPLPPPTPLIGENHHLQVLQPLSHLQQQSPSEIAAETSSDAEHSFGTGQDPRMSVAGRRRSLGAGAVEEEEGEGGYRPVAYRTEGACLSLLLL